MHSNVPVRSDRRFTRDTKNDQQVRHKYNQVLNNNRKGTVMLKLRDFNNFIKWMQVFEFSKPNQIVLDLACGKGGDLEKWRRSGIDGYIGIDIADVSIEQAKERYRRLEHHTFWADFETGNCFSDDIRTLLHPQALPVDIVSCQFAFHYAFDTFERVNQTIENIKNSLKPGGYFIGTIINSDYLSEQIKDLSGKKIEWGNELFQISFDDQECTQNGGKFTKIYGNKYTFYLKEAVDHIPEYVVPFEMLVELFEKKGFTLCQNEPFMRYFQRGVKNEGVKNEAMFKRLANDRGVPTFSGAQLEVCQIYRAFAFKRNDE